MKLSGKKKIIYVLSVIVLMILIVSLLGIFDNKLGICIALGATFIFSLLLAYISYKDDIKLVAIIMLITGALSLILFIINFVVYKKSNVGNSYEFQITVENKEGPKTLLFTHKNKKYYSYNVSNIKVIYEDGKEYTLKDALDNNVVTLSKILSLATPSNNTTGYKIYYDGGQEKYSNDRYSIVVCEGNSNDVIFGTFDYEYEKGIWD